MRIIVRIAALTVMASTLVSAQSHPQTRKGFNLSFGVGGGSATFSCDGCRDSHKSGETGYVRIGGTLRPNLIVAGEIDAWARTEQGTTVSVGSLDGTVQWYPDVRNGFFVLGGVGYGTVQAAAESGTVSVTVTRKGFAAHAGLGYDARVAKNFSLTPFLTTMMTSVSNTSYSSDDKFKVRMFHLGLGLTWH